MCLGLGKSKCEWCSNSVCQKNTNSTSCKQVFDMQCHLESAEPLPNNVRVGIAVFSSFVALSTAIFWMCIFPQCSQTKKADEKSHQSEDSD